MAAVLDASPSLRSAQPIAAARRVFGLRDHTALWFSLGVGLLVISTSAPGADLVGPLLLAQGGLSAHAGVPVWGMRLPSLAGTLGLGAWLRSRA